MRVSTCPIFNRFILINKFLGLMSLIENKRTRLCGIDYKGKAEKYLI